MGFHCSIQVPEPAVTQGISDRFKQTQTFWSLKLKKEVNEGRIAGHFSEPPFEQLFVSPLG